MTLPNVLTYEVHALGPNRTMVFGSFRPQAAGALVAADTAPTRDSDQGFSVARTNVGVYTVTFDKSHTDMESCFVSARKADTTAMVVQGGDYNASNRTLVINTLVDGGGAALTKAIQLPISAARAQSRLEIQDYDTGSLVLGSTPPTLDATCGGLAFDADAELAYLKVRLPEWWGGVTDITATLVWHPENAHTIALGETVIWNVGYRTIADGAAVDDGAAAAIDATYTQAGGASTDKEEIRTNLAAMTYNHADQPFAAGDSIYMTIQRDKTGDTYAFDAVLTRVELQFTRHNAILEEVAGVGDGPYITRVSAADPLQRAVWPAADVTPLTLPAFVWPPDTNAGANATVHLYANMSGAVDTPTVAVDFREGIGDANAGGATGALAAAAAEVTRTIAHADITGHPLPVTVTLTPGAHGTDSVYLYGAWVEYTSTNSPAGLALADLADDVDNRISFCCIFRDSPTGGAAAT